MTEIQRPDKPGPTVTAIAGIAGQGFLILAKEQGWHLPEPLIWIIGALSIIALVVSGWIYARWLWLWVKAHFADDSSRGSRIIAKTGHKLIPLMLGAMGIAGVVLMAAAIAGAIAYKNSEAKLSRDPLVKSVTAVAASAADPSDIKTKTTEFVRNLRVAYETDQDGRQLYLLGEAAARNPRLPVTIEYSARTPIGGWERKSATTRIGAIPERLKGEPIKVSLMPRDINSNEAWYRKRYLGKIAEEQGDYQVPIRVRLTILSDDGNQQQSYSFIAISNDPSGSTLTFVSRV